MDQAKLDQLKQLMLATGAFKFGDFTLSSGRKSDYYCDVRLVSTHPVGAPLIGKLVLDLMQEKSLAPDGVGGLEAGAIPVSSQVQAAAHYFGKPPLKAFYVKKAVKDHGLKKLIEGHCQSGDKVVIVEDVTTTGESALKAYEAAVAVGAQVLAIISILNRQEGANATFAERGIPFFSLLNRSDFGEK